MSAKMKSIVICTVVRTVSSPVQLLTVNLSVMSMEVKSLVKHWHLALDGINTVTK